MSNFTEEKILEFWDKIQAFEVSLLRNRDGPKFVFYDGPPFATGLPHYGHIVASTIKDVVPRYKSQMGFNVERRFGFDTHGLPIEYEIEKNLGIKTREDIQAFGIANYNEECRKIVSRCEKEWRITIRRLGRWVDFDGGYKTMDLSFMESVWWVFHKLWERGLIYHGKRVMPYSTACRTPLSNFEAKSNYKEVTDPSLYVQLPLDLGQVPDHSPLRDYLGNEIYLLVWTTTPWTLPSNLAVCVNADVNYSLVRMKICRKNAADDYRLFILATSVIASIVNDSVILDRLEMTFLGSVLKDHQYTPPFSRYGTEYPKAFRILTDPFVQEPESYSDGTGIVHLAPAFGIDDYRVLEAANIITRQHQPPCTLDDSGCFTDELGPAFAGKYFKDGDRTVLEYLKRECMLFRSETTVHKYPYCWRSDTPLIYKAVDCWFVEVTRLQSQLLENNGKVNWVPEHIGTNTFHKWLENTQDWCVSRNRYWGTPLPIWTSDDGEETVCIHSVTELEQLAGLAPGSITDLHRHHIDNITIPSRTGRGQLHRVPEVLDCWFESGSMPYGQAHYPFRSQEPVSAADFIAEGSDQTRGWFYTLLVLATALESRPAYNNVIVNGLVLAEDGEKMSKRKRNYPPVDEVLSKYGADALRLYLIGSSVVRGESMRFNEEGLRAVVKNIQIILLNSLQWFQELVAHFAIITEQAWRLRPVVGAGHEILTDPLDSWILHSLEEYLDGIHSAMDKYDLSHVIGHIETFIDRLSRWYIKLNKRRFRLSIESTMEEINDVEIGLSVTYSALYYFSIGLAPFAPFISEYIYQQLTSMIYPGTQNLESVHWEPIPTSLEFTRDSEMTLSMSLLTQIIHASRQARIRRQVQSAKMPFKECILIGFQESTIKAVQRLHNLTKLEGNILEVRYSNNPEDYVSYSLMPNVRVLGPLLGRRLIAFRQYLNTLTPSQISLVHEEVQLGTYTWDDTVLPRDSIQLVKTIQSIPGTDTADLKHWHPHYEEDLIILFDTRVDEDLLSIYYLKNFTRHIQEFRRKIGLKMSDQVLTVCKCGDHNTYLTPLFLFKNEKYLEGLVGTIEYSGNGEQHVDEVIFGHNMFTLEEETVAYKIIAVTPSLSGDIKNNI